MAILTINGLTDEELGISLPLGSVGPLWSSPRVERPSTPIPGRYGAVQIGEGLGTATVIPVELVVPEGVSSRRAALDNLLSTLTGLLEVEWVDTPDRVYFATLNTAEIRARWEDLAWLEAGGELVVSAELRLDRPVAYAKESDFLGITDTPKPVPLGTAPSETILVTAGPISSVAYTYRGASGEILARTLLEGTVGAGEYLRTRSDLRRIELVNGAGEVIDMSFFDRTASQNGWIILDPGDADFRRGTYPTLEATEPSVLYYRRAFV